MASDGSVTHWIGQVKAGDQRAAQELWERYFAKLVGLCRKRLTDHPRRVADEEDAALSAFDSFCQGAHQGRFPQLADRDDLWRLLIVIAARKAIDQIQHDGRQKRGGGFVRGESAIVGGSDSDQPWGIEQIIGQEPSVELAAMVAEQYEALLNSLGDDLARQVAQLKLEGYTEEEIARRLQCSARTVQRKIWLIRRQFAPGEVADE